MNGRNKIVDETVFLIRNQTVPEQLLSREENLFIVFTAIVAIRVVDSLGL